MFADFARKSIAVYVQFEVSWSPKPPPFGREEGAIVATWLTIELRQNRVRLRQNQSSAIREASISLSSESLGKRIWLFNLLY